MKLHVCGDNQTVIEINGIAIFFSYNTPVAYRDSDGELYVTDKKYSVTTSKHINRWLGGLKATEVNQEQIDEVIK